MSSWTVAYSGFRTQRPDRPTMSLDGIVRRGELAAAVESGDDHGRYLTGTLRRHQVSDPVPFVPQAPPCSSATTATKLSPRPDSAPSSAHLSVARPGIPSMTVMMRKPSLTAMVTRISPVVVCSTALVTNSETTNDTSSINAVKRQRRSRAVAMRRMTPTRQASSGRGWAPRARGCTCIRSFITSWSRLGTADHRLAVVVIPPPGGNEKPVEQEVRSAAGTEPEPGAVALEPGQERVDGCVAEAGGTSSSWFGSPCRKGQ